MQAIRSLTQFNWVKFLSRISTAVLSETVRYVVFMLCAAVVESMTLISFVYLGMQNPFVYHGFVLPLSVMAFIIYYFIAWIDYRHAMLKKLGAFTFCSGAMWFVKMAGYEIYWRRRGVACPFYSFSYEYIISNVEATYRYIFHGLLQCTWMSLWLFDVIMTVSIGYIVYSIIFRRK